MTTAKDLIDRHVKGIDETRVDEKSLNLAPGSDALNTTSNASMLLKEALTQLDASSRMLKSDPDAVKIGVPRSLQRAKSDLASAKKLVDTVLDKLLKMMD